MDRYAEIGKGSYLKCIPELLQKRVSVPTQKYFNEAYMEETVHNITTKTRQRKKSMTWTNKEEVEVHFNLTKSGNNTMHTFLNNNISEFGGNLEGMLDEGKYRSTIFVHILYC